MKFTEGSNIDKQGRVCLGKFVEPGTKVYLYGTEESDRLIYVVPCDEATDDSCLKLRSVDPKRRIIMPAWARRNATSVWIGRADGDDEIVLKLMYD